MYQPTAGSLSTSPLRLELELRRASVAHLCRLARKTLPLNLGDLLDVCLTLEIEVDELERTSPLRCVAMMDHFFIPCISADSAQDIAHALAHSLYDAPELGFICCRRGYAGPREDRARVFARLLLG